LKSYFLIGVMPDKPPLPLSSIWLILSNSSLTSVLLIVALSVLFAVVITLLLLFLIGALQIRKPHIPVLITRSMQRNPLVFLTRFKWGRQLRKRANSRVTPAPVQPHEQLLLNKPWLDLVEECVELFDELDEHAPGFDAPRREMIKHVTLRLQEILERSGVETIADDHIFDRRRHRLMPPQVHAKSGMPLAEIISPGFAVNGRVFRRAKVRGAETSSQEISKDSSV
jgi:hypothetical protein